RSGWSTASGTPRHPRRSGCRLSSQSRCRLTPMQRRASLRRPLTQRACCPNTSSELFPCCPPGRRLRAGHRQALAEERAPERVLRYAVHGQSRRREVVVNPNKPADVSDQTMRLVDAKAFELVGEHLQGGRLPRWPGPCVMANIAEIVASVA